MLIVQLQDITSLSTPKQPAELGRYITTTLVRCTPVCIVHISKVPQTSSALDYLHWITKNKYMSFVEIYA